MRIIFALGLLALLSGCAERNFHASASPEANAIEPGYLDLQVGWRLVVVMPILKSGGYRLPSWREQGAENLDHLSAGPDFVGYETDYYAVTSNGAGVYMEFRSAEVMKDGKKGRKTAPQLALFELPPSIRYVRLIYLVRVSQADHNMAVVAAEDPDTLANMTRLVQTHPDDGCKEELHSFCSWVPTGIAVRPEERNVVDGVKQWTPVR